VAGPSEPHSVFDLVAMIYLGRRIVTQVSAFPQHLVFDHCAQVQFSLSRVCLDECEEDFHPDDISLSRYSLITVVKHYVHTGLPSLSLIAPMVEWPNT
jgi:hypothetical protein